MKVLIMVKGKMAIAQGISVTTLVSIGEHPLSERPRRAEQDARAIELGLTLAADKLHTLYVGPAQNVETTDVLKNYLGMGLGQIQIIDVPQNTDVTSALLDHFNATRPDVILTGGRAENGESSGMLPYLLAEQLNMAIVASITEIVSIDKQGGHAEVLQALPRGQRRKIKVSLPFIATVDMAAATPRQSAYGCAMRGQLVVKQSEVCLEDAEQRQWQVNRSQKRPKRLKIVKAKTAADRFKAATAKVQGGAGKVIYDSNESAQEILNLLISEGML
ncbi:MAG: electron transfer flavoprotein beta subunit [Paraglaciecola sp.]|jgi:electron transfer flavoprotein beta subunit